MPEVTDPCSDVMRRIVDFLSYRGPMTIGGLASELNMERLIVHKSLERLVESGTVEKVVVERPLGSWSYLPGIGKTEKIAIGKVMFFRMPENRVF